MKPSKARERIIELLARYPPMCKHDLARNVYQDAHDDRIDSKIRKLLDDSVIEKAKMGVCTDHEVVHKFFKLTDEARLKAKEEGEEPAGEGEENGNEEQDASQAQESEETEKDSDEPQRVSAGKWGGIYGRILDMLRNSGRPMCKHEFAREIYGDPDDNRIYYRLQTMRAYKKIKEADYGFCDQTERPHIRFALPGRKVEDNAEETSAEEAVESKEPADEVSEKSPDQKTGSKRSIYDRIKEVLASSDKPMCKHELAEAIYGDPEDDRINHRIAAMIDRNEIEKDSVHHRICKDHHKNHTGYRLVGVEEAEDDEDMESDNQDAKAHRESAKSLKDLLEQAEESHEQFMSAIRGIRRILYGDSR